MHTYVGVCIGAGRSGTQTAAKISQCSQQRKAVGKPAREKKDHNVIITHADNNYTKQAEK